MSQKTSEEPKGGIPQGVADEVAALAAEVRAIERKASAAWKTAVVVWIILLAVIFSYLYFWLYRAVLVPAAKPDNVAALVMNTVEDTVQAHLGARLDAPDFGTVVGGKLKAVAPDVVQKQLKPRIEELLARLPSLRAKYTEEIKQQAPQLIDEGLGVIQNNLLPWANERLMTVVSEQADTLIAQVDAQIKSAVNEVITQNEASFKDLRDPAKLRQAVEAGFEEAMGEVMDELFKDLDAKVADVREKMEEVVKKYKAGTLTYQDKLVLRLIQDVEALFSKASLEGTGGTSQIEEFLLKLHGQGVPEATTQQIRVLREAGQEIDLSNIPEANRETVRKALEEEARAKAAAKAAAGAGR